MTDQTDRPTRDDVMRVAHGEPVTDFALAAQHSPARAVEMAVDAILAQFDVRARVPQPIPTSTPCPLAHCTITETHGHQGYGHRFTATSAAQSDYPCDGCTCCYAHGCHTRDGSECPTNTIGDSVCPCTGGD